MRDTRIATRRRVLRTAAVVMAGSLALAACGQGEDPAASDAGDDPAETEDADDDADADAGDGEQATIRFSWWGSDTRHQMNQDLIEAFEDEHPNITVTPDYTDWGGYWDKLATQTAGGDTPDVLMQEERYLREYADRGVLANRSEEHTSELQSRGHLVCRL